MTELFDTSTFVTLAHCGTWPDGYVTVWVCASACLFVLYAFIAVTHFVARRHVRHTRSDLPTVWVPLIGLMFVGCAGGHVMNALAFTWPAYKLFVVWDVLTVAFSALGAIGMYRIVRWQVRQTRVVSSTSAEAVARLDALDARVALMEGQVTLREELEEVRDLIDTLRSQEL